MSRAELDVSVILPIGANELRSVAYIEQLRSALDEAGYTYEVLHSSAEHGASGAGPRNGIPADCPDFKAPRPVTKDEAAVKSELPGKARGRVIVVVGPGLREDPRSIPRLLAKLKHHDVAIARRQHRAGSLIGRIASRLQVDGCDSRPCAEPFDVAASMKAYRREAAIRIDQLSRMNRIRPNLWQACGVSAVVVHVGAWLFNPTQGENDERLHARPLSR